MEGAERDVDGELASVLALTAELQTHSHRTDLGIGGVFEAVRRVALAPAIRHQRLDTLAHQLLTQVAEELLCLPVDHHYLAFGVDDHHRVRRCLQQITKTVLHPRFLFLVRDRAMVHLISPLSEA